MFKGPPAMRFFALALVVAILATACGTTATFLPPTPGDSSEAGFGTEVTEVTDLSDPNGVEASEPAMDVTVTFDPRISPRLVRDDIDCSAAAFNGYQNGRIVSAYYVVDGQLGANCFGQESVVLVEAWKELVSVAPAEHLRHMGLMTGFINELSIAANPNAAGLASDIGWSAADARISVDLDYALTDGRNLSIVLAHEMAHVLAASRSQTTTDFEAECAGFFYRRCFRPDSLFVEFAALFWLDYLPTFDPGSGPSAQQARNLCERDSGFFTAYAATDPFEDFAESYTTFVHGFEAFTPGQQARLDWFADQPSFVAARDRASVLHPDFGNRWPQQCGR